MDWSTRRKIIYAFAVFITISAISFYLLKDIIFPVPTCFDKKQNGYELGIDCGGICAPRCTSEVEPLVVLWTQALKVSNDTYDIVGMVSNKNIDNASRGISYTFTIYNKEGKVIQEIKGDTIAPVGGDFPIIHQSLVLQQVPHTITLKLQDGIHYKVNEKPTSPTLSITNDRYEAGAIPRVYATVKNNKRTTITNLPVIVVLFDENNNAYAVGGTIIPRLDKEQSEEVSFTWDAPLPSIPIRIKVYPLFDPFIAID